MITYGEVLVHVGESMYNAINSLKEALDGVQSASLPSHFTPTPPPTPMGWTHNQFGHFKIDDSLIPQSSSP
jgi:hypothetical protein